MTTTRRVKKGPGRRPQSAKRARFMELTQLWVGVFGARPVRWVPRPPRVTTGRAGTWRIEKAKLSGTSRHWTGSRCVRSVRVSCLKMSGSRSRTCTNARYRFGGLPNSWVGLLRRSRANCAATLAEASVVSTHPLRLIAALSLAEPARILGGSKGMRTCGRFSMISSESDGARSRSADTCGSVFPKTTRCGCATRASIRPSTSPDPRSPAAQPWPHTGHRRCAQDVIIAGPSRDLIVVAPGLSGRCHDSPTPFRPRGPIPGWKLGGGSHHRRQQRQRYRNDGRTTDQNAAAVAPAVA